MESLVTGHPHALSGEQDLTANAVRFNVLDAKDDLDVRRVASLVGALATDGLVHDVTQHGREVFGGLEQELVRCGLQVVWQQVALGPHRNFRSPTIRAARGCGGESLSAVLDRLEQRLEEVLHEVGNDLDGEIASVGFRLGEQRSRCTVDCGLEGPGLTQDDRGCIVGKVADHLLIHCRDASTELLRFAGKLVAHLRDLGLEFAKQFGGNRRTLARNRERDLVGEVQLDALGPRRGDLALRRELLALERGSLIVKSRENCPAHVASTRTLGVDALCDLAQHCGGGVPHPRCRVLREECVDDLVLLRAALVELRPAEEAAERLGCEFTNERARRAVVILRAILFVAVEDAYRGSCGRCAAPRSRGSGLVPG